MLSIELDTSFFIDLLQYILNNPDQEAKDLGKTFVNIFSTEKSEYPGINTPINKICISLINDILNEELDIEDEGQLAAVELKIRETRAVQKDPNKFQPLLKILSNKKVTPKKLILIEKRVYDKLKWYNSFKPIQKQQMASQKFITSSDEAKRSLALMEIEEAANEVLRALEKDIRKSTFLEYINFKESKHIHKALELNKQKKHESVFTTGLQGLNNILGDIGGFSCGDFCLVIALSGHHKTGTLMNTARWICTLNEPWKNRSGLPSVVFFSLENNINSNTEKWYYDVYCNMFGGSPGKKTLDEMTKIVHEEFNKKGFILHVYREPANGFSIRDYKSRINTLKEKGFDVQAVIFDYLTLMNPDKGSANDAQNIVNMTKEMRDFGQRLGFVSIVGAQAAEQNWSIVCQKGVHLVKKCTPGVIGEAKGIYQIADIVLYQYIEKNHQGKSALTIKCGKYRDYNPTSDYNPFVAYMFTQYGIIDDIFGDDKSVLDIYQDTEEENEITIDIF